jgi:hypothetical protein
MGVLSSGQNSSMSMKNLTSPEKNIQKNQRSNSKQLPMPMDAAFLGGVKDGLRQSNYVWINSDELDPFVSHTLSDAASISIDRRRFIDG